MGKQIKKALESRIAMKKGADTLTDIVKVTLGPKGRNVVIEKEFGEPDIIQDGVTVARGIELDNRFENLGANLVKSVAIKTNDEAGDGTTTAIILAQEMIDQGMKYAELGISMSAIRIGIKKAISTLVTGLKVNSINISEKDQMEQIARISAKSLEIGSIVAELMDKVGKEGVVDIEKSPTNKIEQELVEGFRFDQGFLSPYMITDKSKQVSEYKDVSILITDKAITQIQSLLPIMEKVAQGGSKELVIIGGDISGEALTTLVINNVRGGYKTTAIKAPEYGQKTKDFLEDLAVLTGGTVVSADIGLELADVDVKHLGKAKKVVSTKNYTTVIQGYGEVPQIQDRIKSLKQELENTKTDFDKENIRARLGRLSGVVGIIKVGANSEVEQKELELRVEDAISATQAALEEGIVIGGGLALISALKTALTTEDVDSSVKTFEDEQKGINIVFNAVYKPFTQILINSGQTPEIVLHKIEKEHKQGNTKYGFNAATNNFCDMFKEGIIDPTKVVRCALENAGSIAEMFLSTEAVICFKDIKQK